MGKSRKKFPVHYIACCDDSSVARWKRMKRRTLRRKIKEILRSNSDEFDDGILECQKYGNVWDMPSDGYALGHEYMHIDPDDLKKENWKEFQLWYAK